MSRDVRRLKYYKRLYNMGFSAVGKLDGLAKNTKDVAMRKRLRAQSSEIMGYMFKLKRAQLVELTSPQKGSNQTPSQRLRHATKVAEGRLDELDRLNTALKGASELLTLATRLFRLV